jgi:hypothetical protein
MGNTDILHIINGLSIADRLRLVEEILRNIREEETIENEYTGSGLLEFAGIIDENEASTMKEAVLESREIDLDGW